MDAALLHGGGRGLEQLLLPRLLPLRAASPGGHLGLTLLRVLQPKELRSCLQAPISTPRKPFLSFQPLPPLANDQGTHLFFSWDCPSCPLRPRTRSWWWYASTGRPGSSSAAPPTSSSTSVGPILSPVTPQTQCPFPSFGCLRSMTTCCCSGEGW